MTDGDEPQTEDRVERAESVLRHYTSRGWSQDAPTQTHLTDLLTDLRHLAQATRHEDDAENRLDFDAAVTMSEIHFEAERDEDD